MITLSEEWMLCSAGGSAWLHEGQAKLWHSDLIYQNMYTGPFYSKAGEQQWNGNAVKSEKKN